jgi:hypothetical protein
VDSDTRPEPRITFDTVDLETPLRFATSTMVGRWCPERGRPVFRGSLLLWNGSSTVAVTIAQAPL